MKPDPRLGVAMVLAAAALWGTTGTAQTFASGGLSASWFGALRLVVASAFFAVYVLVTARGSAHPLRQSPWPVGSVLSAGLCMAIYNLAFFAGVRYTGIALGTAVALGSGPLWAGLLQSVVTRQVPTLAWWVGTAVAVSGAALMMAAGGRATAQISSVGVLLCLLSGLSYAAYTLINKELVRVASAASVTLRVFTVAALLAVPAAWLDSRVPVIESADWWAVAYVGIVTAGVAYLLFSHALRHISAATGVTVALFEPVVAFALAILVVGERPSALAFIGLLLVIAGVLGVVRAELKATGTPIIATGPAAGP